LGVHSKGEYALHDLVRLDSHSVGVIVHIAADAMQVINNQGNTKNVDVRDIKEKLSSGARRGFSNGVVSVAYDSHANTIKKSSLVQVNSGRFKGKQGTVMYIFRSFLFLHSRERVEAAGVFVVRARECSVVGAAKETGRGDPSSPRKKDNTMQALAGVGQGRGARVDGRGRKIEFAFKRGEAIVVKRGYYKSYRGNVVSCTDKEVRVDLYSKKKLITLPIDEVRRAAADPRSSTTSDDFNPFSRSSDASPSTMSPLSGSSLAGSPATGDVAGYDGLGYDGPGMHGGIPHTPSNNFGQGRGSGGSSGLNPFGAPITPAVPGGVPQTPAATSIVPPTPGIGFVPPTPAVPMGVSGAGSSLPPQTPAVPSGVPATPSIPVGVPATPSVPVGVPQTPAVPMGGVPQTPAVPASGVPLTPAVPPGVPSTPNVAPGVPRTPAVPPSVPRTPSV